jgi:hypothetical protein
MINKKLKLIKKVGVFKIVPLKYFINAPTENENKVELWSIKRLPFEPKGWLKEMGDDLRLALKKMRRQDNSILYGSYRTLTNDADYDIENILFYNVGSSAFSHLHVKSICFEKRLDSIETPPLDWAEPPNSYSYYEMVPSKDFHSFWKKRESNCKLEKY